MMPKKNVEKKLRPFRVKPTRWFGGYELHLHRPDNPWYYYVQAAQAAKELKVQNYRRVLRIWADNNYYVIYRSPNPSANPERKKHVPSREDRKNRTELYFEIARKSGHPLQH